MLHVALFFLAASISNISFFNVVIFLTTYCDIEVMSLWYIGITVCFLSSSVHEKLSSFFYVSKKDFLRPENPYNVTLEKLWTILNKKAFGNGKFFEKFSKSRIYED